MTLPRMALGVNIDHVATVRQARRTYEPSPVTAAALAELAGADQITLHLREDRRHVQDDDVRMLRRTITTRMNLEMALSDEIIDIACDVRPDHACIVPEKREEVTTEGGLAVAGNEARIETVVRRLHDARVAVTMFIDPDEDELAASCAVGADAVELHTGAYANAPDENAAASELEAVRRIAGAGSAAGISVHAGHGLTYINVEPVVEIADITELNIGHSIIARSVFTGIERAVSEMKDIMLRARGRTQP